MRSGRIERARMNVLQALRDCNAVSKEAAVPTKDIDDAVGDLSRYAKHNTKIVQSLLRDSLIVLDLEDPMRMWLTMRGADYLHSEQFE